MPHLDPPARQAVLSALSRALADPVRLVTLLADAEDDDDAAARLEAAYALTPEQAQTLLDVQLRHVSRARRARLDAAQ